MRVSFNTQTYVFKLLVKITLSAKTRQISSMEKLLAIVTILNQS